MIPANDLSTAFAQAIIDYLENLGSDIYSVVPIIAPYSPGPLLQLSDLVYDTTGSLQPVSGPLDGITAGIDPHTGLQKIYVLPPAGGWQWTYDGTAPPPAVNVYGFALIDIVTPALWATTDRYATPIQLTSPELLILGEMSGLVLPPVLG